MAVRYFFKSGEALELPSNGIYSTGKIDVAPETSVIYIAAYDASGVIVTPTVGIATIEFEDMEGSLSTGVSDGDNPIDLSRTGPSSLYARPLYLGCCESISITISGADFVTDGIDHFKAFAWRS